MQNSGVNEMGRSPKTDWSKTIFSSRMAHANPQSNKQSLFNADYIRQLPH